MLTCCGNTSLNIEIIKEKISMPFTAPKIKPSTLFCHCILTNFSIAWLNNLNKYTITIKDIKYEIIGNWGFRLTQYWWYQYTFIYESDKEKTDGVNREGKLYVKYDKGDREGNRWFFKTSHYIKWEILYFNASSGINISR